MNLNDPKIIRQLFSEGDEKLYKGLAILDDIKRYDNISYGVYGKLNLLDI